MRIRTVGDSIEERSRCRVVLCHLVQTFSDEIRPLCIRLIDPVVHDHRIGALQDVVRNFRPIRPQHLLVLKRDLEPLAQVGRTFRDLAHALLAQLSQSLQTDIAVVVAREVDEVACLLLDRAHGLVYAALQRAAVVFLLGQINHLAGLGADHVCSLPHAAVACVGVGTSGDERAAACCASGGFVQAVRGVFARVAVRIELAERIAAHFALTEFGNGLAAHAQRSLRRRAHACTHGLHAGAQTCASELAAHNAREDSVSQTRDTADDVGRLVEVLR